ncbi:MAG: hypothetical protein KDI16_10280 [Halioglobus sp.]|nr:hypothetical protein [Halioglobus sp.]
MSGSLGRLSRVAGAALVLLAGCASAPPVQIVQFPRPVTVAQPPVQKWLDWRAGVMTLDASQVGSGLAAMGDPSSVDERFYFALLNQQTDDYDAWVVARDVYRQLGEDQALSPGQRQLAGILEQDAQGRINAFQRYEQLQRQYRDLQQHYEQAQRQMIELRQQNALLEEKIKAITDLEATISERREN